MARIIHYPSEKKVNSEKNSAIVLPCNQESGSPDSRAERGRPQHISSLRECASWHVVPFHVRKSSWTDYFLTCPGGFILSKSNLYHLDYLRISFSKIPKYSTAILLPEYAHACLFTVFIDHQINMKIKTVFCCRKRFFSVNCCSDTMSFHFLLPLLRFF